MDKKIALIGFPFKLKKKNRFNLKKCFNPTFSHDVSIATANPGGGKTDGRGVSVRAHRTFPMLFADTCTL